MPQVPHDIYTINGMLLRQVEEGLADGTLDPEGEVALVSVCRHFPVGMDWQLAASSFSGNTYRDLFFGQPDVCLTGAGGCRVRG